MNVRSVRISGQRQHLQDNPSYNFVSHCGQCLQFCDEYIALNMLPQMVTASIQYRLYFRRKVTSFDHAFSMRNTSSESEEAVVELMPAIH